MADNKAKQIIDTILSYLGDAKTYQVVLTMLIAFGVKIETKLQDAITELGIAIANLGKAIENLVIVIKESKDTKQIEGNK
jgi:hypothetical protein